LVVAATVLAVEAAAQDRFVVRGIVGANVGSTTRTTGVWGAGVGVNVGPIVQLTGEVGREIGRATVRDLPLVIDLPSDPSLEEAPPPPGYAIRIVFLERAQVDYFALAGVRLRAPTRRWLNPFGEASIGFARITTHWIPAPAFVGHETRALFELGGGVSLPMKNRLALEIEYRFTRPQAYSGSRNANKLHAALALGI
jgi:opacity protein-like surface antigen